MYLFNALYPFRSIRLISFKHSHYKSSITPFIINQNIMINALRLFKNFGTFKNLKGTDAINKYVTGNKNPVVLDFYSQNCQNCTNLAPRLEKQLKDKDYDVVKININDKDNSEIVKKYNVTAVPRLLVFKQGKMSQQKTGNLPDSELQSLFK